MDLTEKYLGEKKKPIYINGKLESTLDIKTLTMAVVISLNKHLKEQLPKFTKAEQHSNGFTVKQGTQTIKYFIK